MGEINFKAKDKIVYYYIDGKNKAHILFKQTKGYVDIKTLKHINAVTDEFSGREFVACKNQKYEIKSGIPMPNYNDGFGANGYNMDPSIMESIKLHRYQRNFTKFYAGKGLTMGALIDSANLRNDLYTTRIVKQVKFAKEVEDAQRKFENEKNEAINQRQLLERYVEETLSKEENVR